MDDIHQHWFKMSWLPCILTRFSWANSHNFFIYGTFYHTLISLNFPIQNFLSHLLVSLSRYFCNRYMTLFPYKPGPMSNFFRHSLMSRIQNVGLFLRSRKGKITTTPSFLGQKIKYRSNFIWEKLMEFLVINEVFFQ